MLTNSSLKEIGKLLRAAETILIFPHTSPDGDAMGSCAALCRALREEGKTAWVLLDEDIPSYLGFMDTEYFTADADKVKTPDICVCVDCGDAGRLRGRAGKFSEGGIRICLDHHPSSGGFGDYYYIDSGEAAACQIIYKLLLGMGIKPSGSVAASLYTGICTDTGSFRYSNTTPETHRIAAELLAEGIDHNGIMVDLYQNVSYKRLKMESAILDRTEFMCDGRAALSYVTADMLKAEDAVLDDCEGAIDTIRNIEGVEIAAFLKEKEDCVKVSMRAKSHGDVNRIAVKFGGGGHIKAAGCTLYMNMEEALDAIRGELRNYREK